MASKETKLALKAVRGQIKTLKSALMPRSREPADVGARTALAAVDAYVAELISAE